MKLDDIDLSKIQRIGLDKITLSNLAIIGEIDFHKLTKNNDNIEIHQTTNKSRRCRRYMPDTKAGITKIIIKDNQIFQDLIVGYASDSNGLPIEYVYLTITVSNINGNNLENMTHQEYSDYIESTINYIAHQYGIALLYDCVKLDYAEINANILLNYDFPQYGRVLKLLMSLFDNHLGKLSSYEKLKGKGTKVESYRRGNKSKEIVFYDKTQELEDTGNAIEDDLSILRIEIRLKDKKKIKSSLGSCLWYEIDDTKIVECFHQEIYHQLSKKYKRWEEEREKELKRLILNCRKKSQKVWHHLLMQEIRNRSESIMIPYILDIEQVCNAFREMPDPNRNVNRSINSLLNVHIENDIYRNSDIDKVFEIFDTLESYIESVL